MTIKKKMENDQYNYFNNTWKKKWNKKFPNKDTLKNTILQLHYDKFYNVNNAFGKLDKALQICNFLHKLSQAKIPQDTQKIIITILTSCAEAVYKINKPTETVNENLVKGFFKPVTLKIDYKIKGYTENKLYKKFNAVEVLYLIRNDYIHNGTFTGHVFRNDNSKNNVDQMGTFYYSKKQNKSKLINATSECRLTYLEFLNIFLEAFIINIDKYCKQR